VAVEEATGELAPARSSTARNTAIFGGLTGLSRIAGLFREILAANYYGTSGPMSAFTVAFLIPNTVRSLFADSALSGAFIPVFSELIEKKRRAEAFRLASTLFMVMFAALAALTAVFILVAPYVVPLVVPAKIAEAGFTDLTVGLSQLLFPIVMILGLNGLAVGILQAYDRFTIPALSALVWNIVIMGAMVALQPYFHGDNAIYAYAIGIVIGTIVQFLMALPVLRQVGFEFSFAFDWRDPRVAEVFKLMLPVTIGLGLINLNLFANALIGGEISDQVPAAIDKGFRLYMLPQGVFSVAISTVLFPQLARLAARRDLEGVQRTTAQGLKFIFLMLLPATAAIVALSHPITELVYQRGAFNAESTDLVSAGLFWFAFSLPFSGINLLLTRTFFSLKMPWTVTWLSVGNLIVNVGVSIMLIPWGIRGVVIGTVVADAALAAGQFYFLRRELGGHFNLRGLGLPIVKMLVGTVVAAGAMYGVWHLLAGALGGDLIAQIVEVGCALLAGGLAYMIVVFMLRVDEADQLRRLLRDRLRP
jgi:putative peptidoglycan lipid II flippase